MMMQRPNQSMENIIHSKKQKPSFCLRAGEFHREDFIKLAESQGVVFNGFEALNPEPLKKLVSKSRWKNISGTNESGFNAYPAGYSLNNSAPQDGDICEFWTTDGTTVSIQEGANSTHRFTFYNDSANPVYKFNLRFVRNR